MVEADDDAEDGSGEDSSGERVMRQDSVSPRRWRNVVLPKAAEAEVSHIPLFENFKRDDDFNGGIWKANVKSGRNFEHVARVSVVIINCRKNADRVEAMVVWSVLKKRSLLLSVVAGAGGWEGEDEK